MATPAEIPEKGVANASTEGISGAAIVIDEQQVEKTYHHKLDADDALAFLQAHGVTQITPEEDKRILRKIDLVLMPLMLITYTLNFMDKNALSNSVNYGLKTDMNINSEQYSWASGSIFYLTYLVSQPFVSRSLQWFPIGRFISISVILWGATLMTTAACRSFAGIMTVRAILGVFESVINPAFMLLTSQWYKRSEQPERLGWWFMGNAVGQVLGGIIGYGVGHIQSPLAVGNWIWYFIIFGAVTVIYGVVLWFIVPDSPMSAGFLSERDRALAVERVRENRTGIMNHKWKWYQFREALIDPQIWLSVFINFLSNIPSGGVASFGNIVINGFGFSALNTTLLQMPLGVVQAITILIGGQVCTRFKNTRWIVMFVTQIPALIGAVLLYELPSSAQNSRLGSYYIIQTHSIITIMSWAIMTANIAGTTKKATATTMIFVAFCAGQVAAPQLFVSSEAPRYPTAFTAAFTCFSILIVMSFIQMMYSILVNRRRDRLYGKPQENSHGASRGAEDGQQNLEEFYDLTDWEQKESFRYVW